jgi:uncharacterized membrane protein
MQSKYAKTFKALLIYLSRRRQIPQFYFADLLKKKLQNKGKTEELET